MSESHQRVLPRAALKGITLLRPFPLANETWFAGRHKVIYDDNETEFLLLSAETIRWDRRPAEQNAKTQQEPTHQAPEAAGAVADAPASEAADQPLPDNPPQSARGSSQTEAGPSEAPVESKEAEAARLEVGGSQHRLSKEVTSTVSLKITDTKALEVIPQSKYIRLHLSRAQHHQSSLSLEFLTPVLRHNVSGSWQSVSGFAIRLAC